MSMTIILYIGRAAASKLVEAGLKKAWASKCKAPPLAIGPRR
jgi:hypothetical protein